MGRIEYIYNPEKWRIILEGKSKIIDDDYIYKMVIGYCDEELSYSEISIFISKQNYESILRGDYYIKKVPYSISKVILYDREYNMIPLVKGKNIEDCTRKNEEAYNNSTILEDRKYQEELDNQNNEAPVRTRFMPPVESNIEDDNELPFHI